VKDILPGAGSGVGGRIADGDGLLFFTANDGAHGEQLWRTDGTGAGTAMVTDFARAWGTGFHWMKPHLYFTADDGVHGTELWRSDGTARGTGLVRDLVPGAGSLILDAAEDGVHGIELWSSDGTREGTALVADLRPGPESSTLGSLVVSGRRLYFPADDGVSGRELWALKVAGPTR
jgi:ELWxxDGT repeat protein